MASVRSFLRKWKVTIPASVALVAFLAFLVWLVIYVVQVASTHIDVDAAGKVTAVKNITAAIKSTVAVSAGS